MACSLSPIVLSAAGRGQALGPALHHHSHLPFIVHVNYRIKFAIMCSQLTATLPHCSTMARLLIRNKFTQAPGQVCSTLHRGKLGDQNTDQRPEQCTVGNKLSTCLLVLEFRRFFLFLDVSINWSVM